MAVSTIEATPALAWLRARLTDSPGGGVHLVTEVVPAGFPAYVRVFHPWFAAQDESHRSTWQARAQRCGVPYSADMTTRSLPTADDETVWMTTEGELDEDTRTALVRVLDDVTKAQPVFFSYELAVAAAGSDEPLVVCAPLAEVDAARTAVMAIHPQIVGPEHWWPEDRSWVVGSDYDLCSTYLACSQETAERVIADDRLEAVLVSSQTRVDEGDRS